MAKVMRVESGADRISALPDELLCHILSFAPTKMAVRTSVLSTRWRYLYNLLSSVDINIDLRDCHAESEKRCQFLNFMERYLLCHNRQSIQIFRLKWHHYIDASQINRWIGALVSRNIQELDLFNRFGEIRGQYDLQLPDSLFSCKTLVALKLVAGSTSHSLKIPAKASLSKLKALHIEGTVIIGGQFTKLLSSCPVLEDLVLDTGYFITRGKSFKLDISNATLKRLTIRLLPQLPLSLLRRAAEKVINSLAHRGAEIVINSPTLEYLNYTLYDRQSLKLLANQSLAKVVVSGYVTAKHDVLEGINNIQSLEMHNCALEDLHSHRLHPPCFSKLARLVISDLEYFTLHAGRLEYVLAQCVVLEHLIFRDPRSGERRRRTQFLLEPSRMTGMLSHLKRVEVKAMRIGVLEAAFIKLIEFFLNNANVLEELVVMVKHFKVPLTKPMHMMRELITTLPRVSERCIVSFKGRR